MANFFQYILGDKILFIIKYFLAISFSRLFYSLQFLDVDASFRNYFLSTLLNYLYLFS